MGWLSNLFGGGVGEVVGSIGEMVDKVSAGHLGKKEFALEVEKLLHERDMALMNQVTAEIQSKERVLVAELNQGDNYTKRARPTIVYVGLIAAVVDALDKVAFTMPNDFWYVWAGVCGVWIIGRSAEKVGAGGKITAAVTGNGNGNGGSSILAR